MKTARAVPVLMYHHVGPQPGLVTISPEHFRAQMGHLARHGWRTVGLDDLARFLRGEPLPARSVVITFDDGYLDNWVHAHPIMEEYGLHGVIFLITGWITAGPARAHAGMGKAPATPRHGDCMAAVQAGRHDEVMLRWSEVLAMRQAGTFEFHSHTHTHTRWDQVERNIAMRRERLGADLASSRETLAAHLGSATPHLCWPQGYFDGDYVATAQAAGFSHLYTVTRDTVRATASPLAIPRIVSKDRPVRWLAPRLWIYRHPALSAAYGSLRGT